MMRYLAFIPLLAGTLFGAEETSRFESTNENFAITLTSEWKEVDSKTAPFASEVLSDETTLVSRAYQLASETNFAAVVFVEIDDSWRIPEREMALLKVDNLRQTFLTQRLELEGLRLLDSTFHSNRFEVRVSATGDYAKAGKTRQLIGWYFTDKGSYSVTCVAPAEHYKAVGATFAKALDSFYFDPALQYRPRPDANKQLASENKPKVVRIRLGWIFGFGAFVLFLCRRWFTRVNSDEI